LTFQEEKKLLNQKDSPELINMLKLILIMVNEDISKVEDENLFDFLVTSVYKKYNVDNLSKQFFVI
jgi:hypothetical protein